MGVEWSGVKRKVKRGQVCGLCVMVLGGRRWKEKNTGL